MKRKENDGSWLYRVVYIKGLTSGVSRSLEMGTKIDGAKYGLGNGKEHDCLVQVLKVMMENRMDHDMEDGFIQGVRG